MSETTIDKIIKYISSNGQASGKQLTDYLGNISSRAVRKHLKNLMDKGLLKKAGRPPKVYYSLAEAKELKTYTLNNKTLKIIEENYYYISPTGQAYHGWEGFIAWCDKTGQDPLKTAKDYIDTLTKFNRFLENGLIDGIPKMKNTFDSVYVDRLFYLDFYSIERFGKTKLGQMLLYAKQSQNRELMRELIAEIRPRITAIIRKYNIEGVLFIPPTVKREIQFMQELERNLKLSIRKLMVGKIKTEIIIPQKTLSKLADRIENAQHTIIVEDSEGYENILLLDDAIGSGATINETAKQIRKRNICKGIIVGLGITGSFKGFDIISEV